MRAARSTCPRLSRYAAVAVATLFGTSACASSAGVGSDGFVIGYQQGLGSAPVVLMEQSGCLADELPDVEVSFKQFNSGAAIRDSMLAGKVQAGVIGLAPLLVGIDKGIDWRAVTPLNEMDFRLMATQRDLDSLEDFAASDAKIAVPAPDSIQAVVVRQAAVSELGDASALDTQLLAMSHPDAMQALLSGQVGGHLASAPFSYQEESEGAHIILSSTEVFGRSINNTLVAMRDAGIESEPENARAVRKCAEQAKALLADDPKAAAAMLSRASDGRESAEQIRAQLAERDLVWPSTTSGIQEVGDAMVACDLIESVPAESKVLYDD